MGVCDIKDKAVNDAMNSIENRLRHVFNQGYECGRAYQVKEGIGILCGRCGALIKESDNYCCNCGVSFHKGGFKL